MTSTAAHPGPFHDRLQNTGAIEPSKRWHLTVPAALLIVGVGLLLIQAVAFDHVLSPDAAWVLYLALSASLAGLAWWIGSRRFRQLTLTAQGLIELLDQVHRGEAPLDSLDGVRGPLAPLAQRIQSVLRELREQQQTTANLEQEMQQRIMNRTSALERQLSTFREQATRDPLTSLYNRRMLDQMLPQLVQQGVQTESPLSMVMMDIDYFKELNDTLGRLAGDEMLKSLGQIIGSTIRQADAGFRIGGDEFAVLLPGCDRTAAQNVANRLRSLSHAMTKVYKVAKQPQLSIGVCSLEELEDPTPEAFLKKADERLHAFKHTKHDDPEPVET